MNDIFRKTNTLNKDRFRHMATEELKEKSKALRLLIEILLGIFMCLTLMIVFLIFQDVQLVIYFIIPSALLPIIIISKSHVKEIQYELNTRM